MKLEEEIKRYLESKENTGALLATGEWGSGKTYQIKKLQEELNQGNKYAVGIVSLFGISDIGMLNRAVKEELFCAMHKVASKVLKKTNPFFKLLQGGANIAAMATAGISPIAGAIESGLNVAASFDIYDFYDIQNESETDNPTKNKQKKKNGKRIYVLVFDDFERCRINPIEDLMGAINNYCENNCIKTIIIADEQKIKENNNFAKGYNEMKEKIISRTVKIEFDAPALANGIVDGYSETAKGYKNFLISCKQTISSIFDSNGKKNIRSLKNALWDFERIFDIVKEKDYILGKEFKEIFNGYIIIKLENDGGNVKTGAFSNLAFTEGTTEKYYGISKTLRIDAINNWILNAEWDNDEIIKQIEIFCCPKKYSEKILFLNSFFMGLEYNVAQKGFAGALADAYAGELTINEYRRLFEQITTYDNNHIDLKTSVDYNKLQNGLDIAINKLQNTYDEEDSERIYHIDERNKANVKKELQPLYDKLIYIYLNHMFWQQRLRLKDLLESGNRAASNSVYIIMQFDEELIKIFFEKYKGANNKKRCEIMDLLLAVQISAETSFPKQNAQSNINETIKNLETFIHNIHDFSESLTDLISQRIGEAYITKIQERIEDLKKVN